MGSHGPALHVTPDMDTGHSVTTEPDYVSPSSARVLALQLELECGLQHPAFLSIPFWQDPRIKDGGSFNLNASGLGDFPDWNPHFSESGASWHMGNQPGVEPSHRAVPSCTEIVAQASTAESCTYVDGFARRCDEGKGSLRGDFGTDMSPSTSHLVPASLCAGHPRDGSASGFCRPSLDAAPTRHPFAGGSTNTHAERRHGRAAAGLKVRFDFSIQFWFPAPLQVAFPRPSHRCLGMSTRFGQAEHVGIRSPPSFVRPPLDLPRAEHVGLRSPSALPVAHPAAEDFTVFEDEADDLTRPGLFDLCKVSPHRAPLSEITNCADLTLKEASTGFLLPLASQPFPAHLPWHDNPGLEAASPCLPTLLVKGGSCRPFPAAVPSDQDGPPVLSAVRRKPQAKPALHTRLFTPEHTPPSRGASGHIGGTPSVSLSAPVVGLTLPGGAPDNKVPYSAFDSVIEHRLLLAEHDWEDWRFVIEAIKSSVFPGNPLGRFMRHNVAGYPIPQVMVTPAKRFETIGSVVFDLRCLALGIEVIDIPPGLTIAAVLPRLRKVTSFPVVLNALRSNSLRCTVNDASANAEYILRAEAEVIVFTGSLDALSVGGANGHPIISEPSSSSTDHRRPATPPLPRPHAPAMRRWGKARHVTDATLAAARRLEESDDTAPICTIFDPLRQFHLVQSPACARPSSFLTFALAKVSYLGDCLDGRILSFPLPGVPTPQACVHSIVGNSYVVLPVSLGAGSFCTLSVHTGSSVLDLFEQLEQRCGVPRSYRHLLRTGWIVCYINDRAITDVVAHDAFRFADSVRVERTQALEHRESPSRLEDVGISRSATSHAIVVHRPLMPPYSLSADTPDGETLEAFLHDHGILSTGGSLRQTNPSFAQVGNEVHYVALTSQESHSALDWMVADLQHVAHPPLVLFWTAPLRLPFSTQDFAEVLAAEFPSLPVVVGTFLADADLELPQAIQQVPVVTAIGLPPALDVPPSSTSVTTTAVHSTTTTTEPASPPTGLRQGSDMPDTPQPAYLSVPAGSQDGQGHGVAHHPAVAASEGTDATQLVASFDTILHATLHCVPASASLADTVALVLQASSHLTPPLSFRVLRGRFAWLPAVQIVVWTEPLPGLRVIPIHMGNGELDFCTVSVPVEASAYEAAIQIALACPEHERLRYHIARGSRVLFADGQRADPFLAWQLAGADGGIIADYQYAPSRHFPPLEPVPTIVPMHLTEGRFATRSNEVVVHRINRPEAIVSADLAFGPQQLLTRIVTALNAPGSARLSFPAIMPASTPCRLHVVLHPRQLPTSDMATCLLDMRRVVGAPIAPWNVVELPTLCVLSDIQGLLHALYPTDLAYGAIYANYQRLGTHPVGVHRHTVITVLGRGPCDGLDSVYGDGTFGPMCFRGNDVAATRAGLAQFLAYPAHVSSSAFPTSTTTTGSPLLDTHACSHAPERVLPPPPTGFSFSSIFTVFDTAGGVQTVTGDHNWDSNTLLHQAARFVDGQAACVPRLLSFELACLPCPQILVCREVAGVVVHTVVVDLTPFGGEFAVRTVPTGWSTLDLIASFDQTTFAVPPLARLQDATCVCLVNRVIADPRSALDPSTEVVQFYLLRVFSMTLCPEHPSSVPVSFGPPPFGGPLTDHPASGSAQSTGQDLRQQHETRPAAAATHGSVVRLPEGEGR